MTDSDHEEGDMDKLELSSDSTDIITKKRLREEDSEDETKNLCTKKQRNSSGEQSEILKIENSKINSDKNNTDEYNIKEEKHTICSKSEQNVHEKFLPESDMKEDKEKQDNKLIKEENGNDSPFDKDNSMDEIIHDFMNETVEDIKIKEEEKESNEEINEADEAKEESEKDGIKRKRIAKNRIVDTEVVDGLELSVECASDKEEPSSESEDEKEIKPRPKTIIVKAEPNESELECSMSETEKSDSQEVSNTLEIKSEKKVKKRGARTSFSKLKTSESDESQNNSDEDYSPRTKKMKKSPLTKKTKRSVESKRGRSVKKYSYKKNIEHISDDDSVTSTEKINKAKKTKNGTEEDLSEKDSSASENNNNSEDEKELKNKRTRRSSAEPDNNSQIQKLKKYIKVAGIKVKSYYELWADCKNNSARIKRLKELLEKNGISGRPTLEKCKRAKKKKEKMQEVSELDISNIISEGRVTRARRNMNNKSTPPDTPQRYRETRKRIQSIIDSDSE